MRKLYEINHDIETLINAVTDPDTGEVVDLDALEDLLMEREQKIENVILFRKDVISEMRAIGEEIDVLETRLSRLEKTSESLKGYIGKALGGENFKTARCEVTHRQSESVEVDPEFCKWAIDSLKADLVTQKYTSAPNKAEIKKALKNGADLQFCRIVKKDNLIIK